MLGKDAGEGIHGALGKKQPKGTCQPRESTEKHKSYKSVLRILVCLKCCRTLCGPWRMTAESGEESAEDADRSREDRVRMEFQVAV